MAIEYRSPAADELRPAMEAAEAAFADVLEEPDWERESKSVRLERSIAAFDGGRPVGFAAAYEFELTVPGRPVPTAGVTWIGVLPSHRRRGILRTFMEHLVEHARANGEPLAALYASEAAIYGRFGYGIAAPGVTLNVDSTRCAFRDDPGPAGTVRLVDAEEAYRLFPPVYERVRLERPGMIGRSEHWWRSHRLADYEHWRHGASRRFNAVLELDGEVAGYAVYRVKSEWQDGFPRGQVRLIEAFAVSPTATRELWRFLAGIDLTTTIQAELADPALPLMIMLVDPRALRPRLADGLWLQLLDVEAALRARSYEPGDHVVLDVRDELRPSNAGKYRVGNDGVERTDGAAADLRLDVRELASAYLGAFSFERLALAGRVEQLVPGGLARASALFRTPLPPWCPEEF
jgi:predicted acetyltransferase